MSKEKLKIWGGIIAFALCFPLHFIYDKFPNFITSIFAPVNESIWEHMKIIFTSTLIYGIMYYILLNKYNIKYNNFSFQLYFT